MHGAETVLAQESGPESPSLGEGKPASGTMDNSNTSAGERVVAVVQRLVSERSITRLVSSDDTLAEAGLTSLDAVRLVLLVEDDFGIEIPVGELTLANFRSVSTISRLVSELINQT